MYSTTTAATDQLKSLALFCTVVDNYGDIGICWRFARQLQKEHHIDVTLWVDDLVSFQRICPQVASDLDLQTINDIHIRHWRNQDGQFSKDDIADIVIEFFGCNIPPDYIKAMSTCTPRPVWLNLEGLTAETWVEGCHTLPSSHPSLPLTKYFFFPGFTSRTGGLLLESELAQERVSFQSDPAKMASFLGTLGLSPAEIKALKVSLFCYPHAPVAPLFDTWKNGNEAITCLVPEGVASDTVAHFLGAPATAGSVATQGNLTVHVLPFVPQPDYDKLLWACDLNFVRGEDSFVRAQWAGRPFIWHIYPQDENLHHVKLKAFLKTYAASTEALTALALQWNEAIDQSQDWDTLWQKFHADRVEIARKASQWQQQLSENGDMTSNLMKFTASVFAKDNPK